MQHPEILLCFSGPMELFPVQIPFPAIRFLFDYFSCQLAAHPGPHLLLVPGLGRLLLSCAPLSAGSLSRGGGRAWSHLQCHMALVMGSWKASWSP